MVQVVPAVAPFDEIVDEAYEHGPLVVMVGVSPDGAVALNERPAAAGSTSLSDVGLNTGSLAVNELEEIVMELDAVDDSLSPTSLVATTVTT